MRLSCLVLSSGPILAILYLFGVRTIRYIILAVKRGQV